MKLETPVGIEAYKPYNLYPFVKMSGSLNTPVFKYLGLSELCLCLLGTVKERKQFMARAIEIAVLENSEGLAEKVLAKFENGDALTQFRWRGVMNNMASIIEKQKQKGRNSVSCTKNNGKYYKDKSWREASVSSKHIR